MDAYKKIEPTGYKFNTCLKRNSNFFIMRIFWQCQFVCCRVETIYKYNFRRRISFTVSTCVKPLKMSLESTYVKYPHVQCTLYTVGAHSDTVS